MVSQGLAAGCLALGVTAVTSNKLSLEFAFQRAWREWSGSHGFRFIHTGLERNDITGLLHRSERRRGPILAAWATVGPTWEPYLRGTYDLDDAADLLPKFESSISWEQWLELAGLFVAALQPDESAVPGA